MDQKELTRMSHLMIDQKKKLTEAIVNAVNEYQIQTSLDVKSIAVNFHPHTMMLSNGKQIVAGKTTILDITI